VSLQPPYEVRQTWRNHLGNQSVDPLRIYSPRSIGEVADIVRLAEQHGVTTRAVGSGHSWSDVALTEGFLMRTHHLSRMPAPEPDFFAPAWLSRTLVRTEAGIRIKELNRHLDRHGLGLSQMGGYDHECPEPTARAVTPWRSASCTISTTSPIERGE